MAVAVASYFYFDRLISVPNNNSKPADTVEVKEGASSLDVSKSLFQLGAIKSSWAFLIYTKISGRTIKAGVYSLPYNLSIRELAQKFSSGEYMLTKITVPEGKRLEQIAAMLEDKKIFGYTEVLSAAKGQEGKLFPDTYYIAKKTTAAEFVKMMTDNFVKKTASLNPTQGELILASIVERETNIEEQKALIAGIFQNRLNMGMKLQTDPTVLYVNDTLQIADISPYAATQYTFWAPTGVAYSSLDSPYNTYIYEGLPPGPICSPGLASMKAAINPQKSNYIYFLHDSSGQIHPAVNLEQHQANIKQYL